MVPVPVSVPVPVPVPAKLSDFGLALQMVMQLQNTLKQVIYTLIAMFMDMGKSEQSLVNIFTLQHKIYIHLLKEGDQLWY
ncbi:hypothetical protein LWI28_010221 [Acer negundo]|uniref:Uncharacterized protein n=1 Tax=Acer negundo TaxID=4023 RepID=A0AAD5IEC4_ACENE|nr:hypothetical protein LWI28_010221 [Acer negundo]